MEFKFEFCISHRVLFLCWKFTLYKYFIIIVIILFKECVQKRGRQRRQYSGLVGAGANVQENR